MQPKIDGLKVVKIIKKNDNDNYLFEHRIHRKLEKQLLHLFSLHEIHRKTYF